MLEKLPFQPPADEVFTGVCLRSEQMVTTEVLAPASWFEPLSTGEIDDYVPAFRRTARTRQGAYAIQGLASKFISRIDGSYSNVVGLPVDLVYRMLRDHRA